MCACTSILGSTWEVPRRLLDKVKRFETYSSSTLAIESSTSRSPLLFCSVRPVCPRPVLGEGSRTTGSVYLVLSLV